MRVFGLYPQEVPEFQTISSSLSGLNALNNSVDVELLNTTIVNNGQTLFLSLIFLNLAKVWKSFLGDSSETNPSLIIEATKTVDANGTVKIYTYFNNLLYEPCKIGIEHLSATELANSSYTTWFDNSSLGPSAYGSINYTSLPFHANLSFLKTPVQVLHNVSFSPATTNATLSLNIEPYAACSSCFTTTSTYWATSSTT